MSKKLDNNLYEMIEAGDYQVVTLEQLQLLISIYPTADEI